MSDERTNTRGLMLRANERGRFPAISDDCVFAESHTPVFDAARALQDEGVHGDETLEVGHEGSPLVSMRVTVAAAPALAVEEGPSGPRFRAYRHQEAVENDATPVRATFLASSPCQRVQPTISELTVLRRQCPHTGGRTRVFVSQPACR